MRYRFLWVVGCLALGVWSAQAATDEADIREAIVKIYTVHNVPDYYNPWSMRGTQQSTGSGCIISGNRILTNGHVVRDSTFIQVRRFGESRRYQAHVLFVSHQADIALLTVDDPDFFGEVEPLEFGELPRTQQEVNVYGFPMGGDTLSITKGVISRIEHTTYAHSSVPLLAGQIDAAINPGNSGGPAIVDGKIVGVAMQGISQADNIGYIVPVPVIQHFLTDIEDGRRNGIPSLGVVLQDLENPDMRRFCKMADDETGVLVLAVIPGSSAEGILEEGDVITRIKGWPIADDGTVEFRSKERTAAAYYVQENQVGQTLPLEVLRNGKKMALEVPLTRPMEADWLIPMEVYDVLPTYYVYGGIVFVPLSKNLLMAWGPNWFNTAPKEMVAQLSNNAIQEDKDEIVVALKVLPADVNQGYHDETHWIIDQVNGESVRNLRDLIAKVEAGAGAEYVIFENTGGRKMILDRAKAESSMPSILSIYRIAEDRSDDLKR